MYAMLSSPSLRLHGVCMWCILGLSKNGMLAKKRPLIDKRAPTILLSPISFISLTNRLRG